MRKNLLAALCLFASFTHASEDPLTTLAEKSGFIETGRLDETIRLCAAFQKKFPSQVRCKTYGKTPEGRPLVSLIVNEEGNLTAEKTKKKGIPVVFVQAGIHAGEIDGKDAGFWLLKEILTKKITPSPLKGSTLVFVPIVNVDGHERFGPHNRPNQIGPKEMGWRTTAQNLNMNRDFAKVDSPEMQALLALWNEWMPTVSADLHVTDGAQFQHEVGIIVTPTLAGPEILKGHAKTLESNLIEKMEARGRLPLPFYPEFEKDDDPTGGFGVYVPAPRLAHGYWFRRNRIGMLIETHSWKDYKTRVKTHHDLVLSLLELAQKNGKDWMKAEKKADEEALMLGGKDIDLEFTHNEHTRSIDFKGYSYKIEDSKVSGAKRITYFPDKPEIWKIPLYDEVKSKLTVKAPLEGYWVPPAYQAVLLPKLKTHAIEFKPDTEAKVQTVEVFRASSIEFSKKPFEGRQTLKLKGEWKKEERMIPEHSLFVPIRQKNPTLVMTLLEPLASDSFLAWGYLNAAYEKKEYMEAYVAEELAEKMLKDGAIREEFEKKIAADPGFSKDPEQRLEFFYRKHPSWDERYGLYPIFRK